MDALVEANLEKERCQVKIKELKTTNESIQKDVTTKEDIILKLRHELAAAAAASDDGDSKVNQETVDGIEMLEKHLIKLSEKLRNKNNEVEQLQGVIHRECIQRGILMDELEELRTK
jgi:predicted RNase H-like nuclease (RuvC/YqgF family)